MSSHFWESFPLTRGCLKMEMWGSIFPCPPNALDPEGSALSLVVSACPFAAPVVASCCFGEESHWTKKKYDLPMEYTGKLDICTCNSKQTDGKIPKSIYHISNILRSGGVMGGPEVALWSPSATWLVAWWAQQFPLNRQLLDIQSPSTAGFLSLKLRPVQNLAWNLKATSTIDPPERKQGWLNQLKHKTIWTATR